MEFIVTSIYLLYFAGFIIVVLISWFIWEKRFKKGHGSHAPHGFVSTDEVFYDPVTDKKMHVYYHPYTGERFYKTEE